MPAHLSVFSAVTPSIYLPSISFSLCQRMVSCRQCYATLHLFFFVRVLFPPQKGFVLQLLASCANRISTSLSKIVFWPFILVCPSLVEVESVFLNVSLDYCSKLSVGARCQYYFTVQQCFVPKKTYSRLSVNECE